MAQLPLRHGYSCGLKKHGRQRVAAVRTWPFRVYSFPSQKVIPHIFPSEIIPRNGRELLDQAVNRAVLKFLDDNPMRFTRSFSGGELQLGVRVSLSATICR